MDFRKLILSNKELRNFQRSRLIKRYLKTLFFVAVLISLSVYLYIKLQNIVALIIGICVSMILIYIILSPAKYLRSIQGKVAGIKYFQTRANNKNGFMFGYTGMIDVTVLLITIVTHSGKKRKVRMDFLYNDLIKEGDEVIFMAGVPFPIVDSDTDKIICPYCGNVMNCESESCIGCGHGNIYIK